MYLANFATPSADVLHRPAWLFELAGGALVDFENSCLPKSQRQAAFTVAALHQWDIDFEDPRCIESAEEVGPLFFSLSANFLTIA